MKYKEIRIFLPKLNQFRYFNLDNPKDLRKYADFKEKHNEYYEDYYLNLFSDDGEKIYSGDIVEVQSNVETSTSYQSPVLLRYEGAEVLAHPAHREMEVANWSSLKRYCSYGFGEEVNPHETCKVKGNIYRNLDLLEKGAKELGEYILKKYKVENETENKIKTYEIWSEGFVTNGSRSSAMKHGTAEGKSFKEACINLAKQNSNFAEYFDEENMDYWGCQLFQNERNARRSFG